MVMFVPLCFLLYSNKAIRDYNRVQNFWLRKIGNSKLKINNIQKGKFQHTGRCDYSSLGVLV